jgi:hypothetical protein
MCINVQHPAQSNTLPGTVAIEYVFPNTADIPQRGGLDERRALAGPAGCSFVEVPADMIKNGSEVSATGQDLCTFLNKQSIATLYKPTKNSSTEIPYILHTEPSLGRTDGFGISTQAPLRWHDPVWVDGFIRMVLDISEFLGTPAAKIEIHPGDRRNSFADIAGSIQKIQNAYEDVFGMIPEILLENRTGQFISDGDGIARFWEYIKPHDPDLTGHVGFVLDIQQLFTVTRRDFAVSFAKIPDDSLKGFHIHTLHRPPMTTDRIPWSLVFQKIAGFSQDIIINPEIHHNNKVPEVIRFCNRMLLTADKRYV